MSSGMWQDADGAFIAYQEPTPDDVALAAASIAALSEQMWHLMHPGLEAKDSPELLEEWPVGCYGCFRTNGLLALDRFSSAARRSIQNERCFAFGGREHQGSVARENIHHLKPRLCLSCTQFTDQYNKWKAARRCIECSAIMTAGENSSLSQKKKKGGGLCLRCQAHLSDDAMAT